MFSDELSPLRNLIRASRAISIFCGGGLKFGKSSSDPPLSKYGWLMKCQLDYQVMPSPLISSAKVAHSVNGWSFSDLISDGYYLLLERGLRTSRASWRAAGAFVSKRASPPLATKNVIVINYNWKWPIKLKIYFIDRVLTKQMAMIPERTGAWD